MGCNCKATENILKIQKKFGTPTYVSFRERFQFNIEEAAKFIVALVLVVLLSPFIFIFLLWRAFNGKTVINTNKLLQKLLRHKQK